MSLIIHRLLFVGADHQIEPHLVVVTFPDFQPIERAWKVVFRPFLDPFEKLL